jgi:deazaflavin-dependent oxidoreductase (nitroreductase family)
VSEDLEDALRTSEELELETRGRRTGTPHRVTVWFAYDGDALWLRTDRDADWLRNLERDPAARVRVGGHEVAVRRQPVDDEADALRRLIGLWRAKYGQEWVADWYVERGRVPVRLSLERTQR